MMQTDTQSRHDQSSPQTLLRTLDQTNNSIRQNPYNIYSYIILAQHYVDLAYPDLAAGTAYKALILCDAAQDDADENHDHVMRSFHHSDLHSSPDPNDDGGNDNGSASKLAIINERYLPKVYRILVRSLLQCGCCRSAFTYYATACKQFATDSELQNLQQDIRQAVADRLHLSINEVVSGEYSSPATWPDSGLVRREKYPWNTYEPDRLRELSTLNDMMSSVAPKLEVLAVDLPNLSESDGDGAHAPSTVQQLGVFAKEDLTAGEIVLTETSMLTANNKLQDALCDACSGELPNLDGPEADASVACSDCEVVFCSEQCHDQAQELYHPALCDMDVESIAKDVPPTKAPDALYSLLLLRAMAMAETQQCHPLELQEVKYIWGDFYPMRIGASAEDIALSKTLPFDFEHNIRLPFHMLEKMDIDVFANPQYDVWVFNTLYAKFRGTASARLSGLGGQRARGPEVSAVHPMWCLANHSCDPNVSWDWGGSVEFRVRAERMPWQCGNGKERQMTSAGVKKGEEILNHYCDIELPVNERRAWARGALGGDCRCPRCIWEAGEKV